MVIGLHGDSTANVPRVVEEAHSTEPEFAITRHPQAEVNTVLDHLNKQTCAIPKGVLVSIYIFFWLFFKGMLWKQNVKFVLGWSIRRVLSSLLKELWKKNFAFNYSARV